MAVITHNVEITKLQGLDTFHRATEQLKSSNEWISQEGNCLNAVSFVKRSLQAQPDLSRKYSFDVKFSAQQGGSFYHALLSVSEVGTGKTHLMDVVNDQCMTLKGAFFREDGLAKG